MLFFKVYISFTSTSTVSAFLSSSLYLCRILTYCSSTVDRFGSRTTICAGKFNLYSHEIHFSMFKKISCYLNCKDEIFNSLFEIFDSIAKRLKLQEKNDKFEICSCLIRWEIQNNNYSNLIRDFGSEWQLLIGEKWDDGRSKAALVIDNNFKTWRQRFLEM